MVKVAHSKERARSSGMIWIIVGIILAVIILFSVLGYFAYKLGKNTGDNVLSDEDRAAIRTSGGTASTKAAAELLPELEGHTMEQLSQEIVEAFLGESFDELDIADYAMGLYYGDDEEEYASVLVQVMKTKEYNPFMLLGFKLGIEDDYTTCVETEIMEKSAYSCTPIEGFEEDGDSIIIGIDNFIVYISCDYGSELCMDTATATIAIA